MGSRSLIARLTVGAPILRSAMPHLRSGANGGFIRSAIQATP